MPVSPARAAAYEILLRVEREDSYASELLHSARCAELTATDHGLATELVMGVLRWRSALDSLVGEASSQRVEKLDPEVLTALRLAVYQLGWLDRIPARAATYESVELVKRARKRSAAPFVNAVLRRLAASQTSFQAHLDSMRSVNSPSALAEYSAHPAWMVERWVSHFGLDIARKVCAYDQSIPTTAVRLCDATVEDDLRCDAVELEAGAFLASARRVRSGDITKTTAYKEGRVVIQDEASQLVAALVGDGRRILDCCAAPGGKTLAIADRNSTAFILAAELHPHRADLLRKRITATNVEVVTTDVRELLSADPFDRVLVDVPCSGTGTLARNPEIKWRLKPADLANLRFRQLSILEAAMKQLAPGGRLIYSTCSLEKEEDESIVEEALRRNKAFQFLAPGDELQGLRIAGEWVGGEFTSFLHGPYLRTIPGIHPSDGFFVAILTKSKE
jgi:16S rRNA (cytosine967-C5)-methyltransferase